MIDSSYPDLPTRVHKPVVARETAPGAAKRDGIQIINSYAEKMKDPALTSPKRLALIDEMVRALKASAQPRA